MNPQLERLFHSVRRGIEANVKTAIKAMEVPRKKDLDALKDRIDDLRKTELVVLKKKLDEVRVTLGRVESLKPYISALEAATRAYTKGSHPKSAKKRAPKKSSARRKKTKRASKA